MNKQNILNNVDNYSSSELAGFIEQGLLTLDELRDETGGFFTRNKEKEVQACLNAKAQELFNDALNSNDPEAIRRYIGNYGPQGHELEQLNEKLRGLEELARQRAEEERQQTQINEWERIKDCGSIDTLQHFLNEYPDFVYRAVVEKAIAEIEWKTVDAEWAQLSQSNNWQEIQNFANKYPNYPRISEVCQRIEQLQNKNDLRDDIRQAHSPLIIRQTVQDYLNNAWISKADLLDLLGEDKNLLHAETIRDLVNNGVLDINDLFQVYGNNLVRAWRTNRNQVQQQLPTANPITQLQQPFSEVYFWGIPSSGKTCALGALLSTLGYVNDKRCDWGTYAAVNTCQGYGYMAQLQQMFSRNNDNYFALPQSTGTSDIYEMSFTCTNTKGEVTPISFIDLAGELFRAMFLDDAKQAMNQAQINGLNTLRSIFNHKVQKANRKVHCFVLEYDGHNRLHAGLPQDIYLNAAARWLEELGTFKHATDAIYLIVTKSDKIQADTEDERDKILIDYMKMHYSVFYNALKDICRKYDINGGKLELFPFSIGEVYMQDYCLFKPDSSIRILNNIYKNAPKNKKLSRSCWLNKFLNN